MREHREDLGEIYLDIISTTDDDFIQANAVSWYYYGANPPLDLARRLARELGPSDSLYLQQELVQLFDARGTSEDISLLERFQESASPGVSEGATHAITEIRKRAAAPPSEPAKANTNDGQGLRASTAITPVRDAIAPTNASSTPTPTHETSDPAVVNDKARRYTWFGWAILAGLVIAIAGLWLKCRVKRRNPE